MSLPGRLVLCSYGSGDPELLPLRTVNALGTATLVLMPDSTPRDVVDFVAPDARRETFPLGSAFQPGERVWADAREELGIGGTVVRLYPDSPQIDPVALREARMLLREGVGFEVVNEPVISLQAACYAGVPLDLDRDTISLMGQQPGSALNAPGTGTAIVMVGKVVRQNEIAEQLLRAGYGRTTPCLVIERPASPTQAVRESKLGQLLDDPAPATGGILVAGEAVRQRGTFNWFERLPLYGKRVLVTRARTQAGGMSARLRQLGAEPIELPVIEIVPPADLEPLDDAIARLDEYDWVVFTSANGVAAFFARLDESERDVRALGRVKLAAIGSATAAELRARALKADFVPERFVAEEVLAGLLERGAADSRILLPRAERAREILPDGLREAGATVDVVPAYRTIAPEPSPAAMQALRTGAIDVVTLTSSSTARNLSALLGGQMDTLKHARIACIGPITAQTARELGFEVDIIAAEFSVPGLIAAIITACERSMP